MHGAFFKRIATKNYVDRYDPNELGNVEFVATFKGWECRGNVWGMPQAWRKGNGGKVFTLTRCSATSVIGKRHNHDTSSIEQPTSGVTARILILKGNEKWAGLSHSFLRVRRWLFWQVRSWLRARLPQARPVALPPMGLTHVQRAPSPHSEAGGLMAVA
ncbi:hypothetical protein QE369_000965 [Agrobacterium larrymoorei]|uniref:Uncharacterized protein n=1 Tax=Agrobacterium larrymoorei TaxID=160699 RepID=A0AAJ2B9X7_9HYPH|nr:hypothetical protein [Agrobacterium larrymoorei]MDR6100787.1 hypothetical protein [Agrobacterium larrymoorei]